MTASRKSTLYDLARGTAFKNVATPAPEVERVHSRLRRVPCLLLAAMPGALGAIALAAAIGRSGTEDGAFPLAVGALLIAASLLVLGLWSRLSVTREDLTVRFFGIRSTSVRFDQLVSSTFGMTLPSISFGLALQDHRGARVVVHANWWQDEKVVLSLVCRRLLEHDVPMDHETAVVVARTLGVPEPPARIIRRPLLRRDRHR